MDSLSRRTRGRERRKREANESLRRARTKMRRDEGNGGSDGVVLDLELVGDGIMSAVYTVPVTVGENNQSFRLQVDTGSSDLWIASKSCSTKECSANKPRLYDPSSSTPTDLDFSIQYLSGEVDGPIVWDRFTLGGYTIENQALSAATNVVNESLNGDYSGILGLALPLNSVISKVLPPGTGNVPDGATVFSNLFGITPIEQAPTQLFYSVLLGRPNIDRIPSVLGIGRHPSNSLLSDGLTIEPSKVTYSDVIAERDGSLFWKTELRGIVVYVNGTRKEIDIGRSVTGSVFPEAVLDTGVPYIISTPQIANAVWGALGVSPASDGNYYVPCTTPLNLTISLDDRSEIPLHPLDLSAVPASGGSSCTGLFQQSPFLANYGGFGDIILGVPFLRNVYTVMSYTNVSSNGTVGGRNDPITPQLGLLNLTDPNKALDEFNTVRVLNQPLSGSNNNKESSSSDGMPVGVKVLFGLLGFVGLCGGLFLARWLWMRRKSRRANRGLPGESELSDKDAYALAKYHLAPFRSHSFVPSEDTQKTLADPTSRLDAKYDTLHNKGRGSGSGSFGEDELGFRRSKKLGGEDGHDSADQGDGDEDGDGDGHAGEGEREREWIEERERGDESDRRRQPRIGEEGWDSHRSWIDAYSEYQPPLLGEWRPPDEAPTLATAHERSYSSSSVHSVHAPSSPLLPSDRRRNTLGTMPLESEVDEFGGLDVNGLVGIGSGRRMSTFSSNTNATLTNPIDAPRSHSRQHSRQQSRAHTTSSYSRHSVPHSHSRMSTASVSTISEEHADQDQDGMPRVPSAHARTRPTRTPSGPRTSSIMSVINAKNIR